MESRHVNYHYYCLSTYKNANTYLRLIKQNFAKPKITKATTTIEPVTPTMIGTKLTELSVVSVFVSNKRNQRTVHVCLLVIVKFLKT
jgi:hypothetical protein